MYRTFVTRQSPMLSCFPSIHQETTGLFIRCALTVSFSTFVYCCISKTGTTLAVIISPTCCFKLFNLLPFFFISGDRRYWKDVNTLPHSLLWIKGSQPA